MILYVVEYSGPISNDEWSTINIWKTRENAEDAVNSYKLNWPKDSIPEYRIVEIDTDIEDDCIYDVIEENESDEWENQDSEEYDEDDSEYINKEDEKSEL